MPLQDVPARVRQEADAMRDQAQVMRDQAQAMRDVAHATRDAARAQQGFPMYMPGDHLLSRRHEGMFFVAFLVCVMAAVAIFRPLVRALGRRLEGAGQRDGLAVPASAERLERIEQAVEAMAVEIERISEGQRFTTRLLMSRSAAEQPAER